MAPPYPTLTALRALRVVDLKQRLADLGLPQSGLKADLVARLDAHFNSLRQQEADDEDEAVSPPAGAAQVGSWGQPTLGFQAQEAQQQALAASAMAMRSPTSEYAQPAQFGMGFGSPQQQQYGMESYGMASPPIQTFPEPMMQQAGHHQQFLAEQQRQEELRRQEEILLQRQREQQEALLLQQQQREEEERRLQQQVLLRQQAEREERERQVLLLEQQRREEEQRLEDERRRQQQALLLEQQRQMEMLRRQQEEEEERRRQEDALRQLQEERLRQELLRQQEEQIRLAAELQRQREMAAEEERLRLMQQQQQQEQEEKMRLAEAQRQKEAEERQRLECLQQQQEDQMRLAEAQRQKELKEAEERQRLEHLRQQQEEDLRLAELERQKEEEAARQRQEAAILQQQLAEQERQQKQVQIRLEASKAASSVVSAPARITDSGDLEDDPTPAGPISAQAAKGAADIPKAVQDAFDYQAERARVTRQEEAWPTTSRAYESLPDSFEADDDETESSSKADTDKRRGKKKKKKRRNRPEEWARQAAEAERRKKEEEELKDKATEDVEVVYVQDKLDLDPSDPMYRTFAKIFDAFKITEDVDEKAGKSEVEAKQLMPSEELKKVPKLLEDDDLIEEKDDDDDDDKPKLSKRKLKLLNRLSVAELKQLVPRPDVVEMHDVTARDPRLLVHLKSVRNSVPVPRHWCFKRKYLQGKRGIEKPPFNLPEFIKKTGIMEMRAALQEKEDAKNLKSKMREKVRPKLGKIDIDYQKLHDAFFKWQTKPRMSGHGDLYYEGKEFEIRLKEKKPGDLTDDLRTALGMPVGPNAFKVPPPWLIAMQRYGPPPSYPNLRIPGLNAGIPEGCSFGYHAGGWGKPPVDESGKPLYGDVFGSSDSGFNQNMPQEEIDTTLWGEMESESEEEMSEEEEDEGEEGDEEDAEARQAAGLQTPVIDAGLTTPSGLSSVGASMLGAETPELLELRKKRIEAEMEGGETPNLFTVLPEKRHERVGGAMMGSTHTYDLKRGAGGGAPMDGGIELALNPDEVDLVDTDAMRARAEAAMRERREALGTEDFSDMVAEHAAKQSSKRKRPAASGRDDSKSAKKYKEFKF